MEILKISPFPYLTTWAPNNKKWDELPNSFRKLGFAAFSTSFLLARDRILFFPGDTVGMSHFKNVIKSAPTSGLVVSGHSRSPRVPHWAEKRILSHIWDSYEQMENEYPDCRGLTSSWWIYLRCGSGCAES